MNTMEKYGPNPATWAGLPSRFNSPYGSNINPKIKGDILISPFSYLIFTRFNRNALDSTESELIAIAAPAKTGLK